MYPIEKIMGRLSNKMFIMAAWYAHCKVNSIPFFAQDEKYFEGFEDEIKAMYSVGINPNSMPFVAIHRRLGKNPVNPDEPAYNENPFYVDLGHHEHEKLEDNYFMRAMALFPEDTNFMVFSDDIEKAKKEPMFQGEKFQFSVGDEISDMNNMASCRGIIGSNSSFSWWAAYLSGAEKIIFPKKWFSNPNDEQFIGIPKQWIRI